MIDNSNSNCNTFINSWLYWVIVQLDKQKQNITLHSLFSMFLCFQVSLLHSSVLQVCVRDLDVSRRQQGQLQTQLTDVSHVGQEEWSKVKPRRLGGSLQDLSLWMSSVIDGETGGLWVYFLQRCNSDILFSQTGLDADRSIFSASNNTSVLKWWRERTMCLVLILIVLLR